MSVMESVIVKIKSYEGNIDMESMFIKDIIEIISDRSEDLNYGMIGAKGSLSKDIKELVNYNISESLFLITSKDGVSIKIGNRTAWDYSDLIKLLVEKYAPPYHISLHHSGDEGFYGYMELYNGKIIKIIDPTDNLLYLGSLDSEVGYYDQSNLEIWLDENEEFGKSDDYNVFLEIVRKYDFIDSSGDPEDTVYLIGNFDLNREERVKFVSDMNKVYQIVKPYGIGMNCSIFGYDYDMNIEQIVKIDDEIVFRHSKFMPIGL